MKLQLSTLSALIAVLALLVPEEAPATALQAQPNGNTPTQIGQDLTTTQSPSQSTLTLTSASAVTTGDSYTCALTTSGGVKCWGHNDYGQLGDGTTIDSSTPVGVNGLSSGVTAISAGGSHTCALTSSGGVKCWGLNKYGQLGNGTTISSSTPVSVSGMSGGITAISAGWDHTCALSTFGYLMCWGHNDYGQLGVNPYPLYYNTTPVFVSGLGSSVMGVSASGSYLGGFTCAVTSSGGAKCWGRNYEGQLGNGTTDGSFTPVDVSGLTSGVSAVSAGEFHACAINTSGGVRCWGQNGNGQLGNNSSNNSTVPVDVSGLTSGVRAISTGEGHTCALTTAGGVKCWGGNWESQLGDNTLGNSPTPVDVTGLTSGVQVISAGGYHTCAVVTTGGVKCWGGNYYGQLGNGKTTYRAAPVDAGELTTGVAAVFAGGGHTCALTTTGGVKCWGNNGGGQLGNNSHIDSSTPVDVSGLTAGVSAVSVGEAYTCALTSSGGIKCWGSNLYGQYGNGTFTSSSTPVNADTWPNGVVAVVTGKYHTCALVTSGGIKCSGRNDYGQLGNNTTTDSSTPVSVSGLSSGMAAVFTGWFHTCALTTSGGTKCWGLNYSGQLGDGGGGVPCGNGGKCRLTPVNVIGLTSDVKAIAVGQYHTCALTTAGGVLCWGQNTVGQLGNGTTTSSLTPTLVFGLTSGITAISAGSYHTCALTTAGGVLCWGDNWYGQLGNNSTTYSSTPVSVSGLTTGVAAISVGDDYTCALTTSGGVKCWGGNDTGQLGISPDHTPVDVVDFGGIAPTIYLGFHPYPDGYSFDNYGEYINSDYTVDDMVQMFGRNTVCNIAISNYCKATAPALEWQDKILKKLNNGRCFGMAVTSVRLFTGPDTPSMFQIGAAKTYDLYPANSRHYITYYQLAQFSDPLSSALITMTPNQVLAKIRNFADPTVLFFTTQLGSGHIVTPYAYQDRGNGIWWIWVYENELHNNPNQHFVFDTTANTWSYSVTVRGTTNNFHGDASTNSIGAIPVSQVSQIVSHGLVCPWCSPGPTQAIWYTGLGHLLITDAQGKRIGVVNGDLVNEIPGASASVHYADYGAISEPTYSLPLTDTYAILLTSPAITQSSVVSAPQETVTQSGPNYVVSLEDANPVVTSTNRLVITNDGTQLSYVPSNDTRVTMTLALGDTNLNYQFEVRRAGILATRPVTLTYSPNRGQLIFNNSQNRAGTYDLAITRDNTAGEQLFYHAGVPISASDTHLINYGDWGGSGAMTVVIDIGSTGAVTSTMILSNQVHRIYLPIILHT